MVGRFETFRFDQSAVAGATADSVFAGIWPGMAGTGRQKAAFFVILVVINDTIGRDSGMPGGSDAAARAQDAARPV